MPLNQQTYIKKNKTFSPKKILFLFVIVINITILLLIYEYVTTLSIFKVKEISVKGNVLIPTKFITNKTIKYIDQNIFSIKLQELYDFLKNIRIIESFSVRKQLPNKIVIKIKERIPSYLLLYEKELYYLDHTGYIMYNIDSSFFRNLQNKTDYIIISGLNKNINDNLKGSLLKKALDLIQNIKLYSNNLKEDNISEVVININKGIVIKTIEKATSIIFGFDNFKQKLEFLDFVLENLKDKNIVPKEINLDISKKVVVNI